MLNGKVNYKVFVQGVEFFTGQSGAFAAAANDETDFTLEQDIELAKVFGSENSLLQAVLGGQKSIKVRVAGQYILRALGFYDMPIGFDQTVEVPLPDREQFQKDLQDKIDRSLQNIDWQGLGNILQNL
ncbi:hypothetical protein NO2_1397 [Candidatus Termititenax persephonae]|uniref:Uncharacterized protein n=1 Tax=Candidatus Termititenax persephonae TaxID=2218525 RepID=A0A388TIW4_9BACT|nr:hypothetical protein NO2_1397 [Candidatus Termititenax persephonae]